MENDNKKPIFLTYEELINKLKNKGLLIVDKSKLLWYIKSYNYENIINKFNKPFYQNNGYKSKKYLQTSNSQMIIDFFNFNRSISSIIINDLHTIEMKLSSSIAYEIMSIIKGPCLNLLINESIIFNVKNKDFKDLQNELINWRETPLYSLCLTWTFGMSIKVFNNLNNSIQQKILRNYFRQINNIKLDTFRYLLYSFKELRNKISHNNVIYNFKLKKINEIVYKIISKNELVKNDRRIKEKTEKKVKKDLSKLPTSKYKLIDIVRIIAKVTNNQEIENLISKQINKLKLSIFNGFEQGNTKNIQHQSYEEAWNNICNFLGFTDELNI